MTDTDRPTAAPPALLLLEGIHELQRIRGRLSKVTPDDIATLLDAVGLRAAPQPDDDGLRRAFTEKHRRGDWTEEGWRDAADGDECRADGEPWPCVAFRLAGAAAPPRTPLDPERLARALNPKARFDLKDDPSVSETTRRGWQWEWERELRRAAAIAAAYESDR